MQALWFAVAGQLHRIAPGNGYGKYVIMRQNLTQYPWQRFMRYSWTHQGGVLVAYWEEQLVSDGFGG